ncbi:MAG: S9 family peptidase [Gemmatimonadales bacterium]
MRLFVFGVALLVAASSAPAQVRPSDQGFTVDRYLEYETVAEPAIAPDGRTIVFVRRSVDRMHDDWRTGLWVVDADGSRLRYLGEGSSPVWSPDGSRIAFLRRSESGGVQLFVRYMDDEGAVTQITRLEEAPQDVQWSPDGRALGFAMVVPAGPDWKVALPEAPEGARWTPAPRLVERLHYRADRRGWLVPGYTHLFTVPAAGGTPRQITSGKWNVGARGNGLPAAVGWAWFPDGQSIVVEGNDDPDANRQRQVSNIYRVDLATLERTLLTPDRGYWTSPTVSPNGRMIAWLGYPFTRQTYRTADLYLLQLGKRAAAEVRTAGFDRTPASVTWAPDNSGLYFTADDQGTSNVHFVSTGGNVRQLTVGTHLLTGLSVSRRHQGVLVRTHSTAPPDLVLIDLKKPERLTRLTALNRDLLAGVDLGEVEEIWVRSGDTRVQGWIVKPPSFTPDRKWPLILEIHGGPHAMYHVGFNPMYQNFAAAGFVTLYLNPRGSTGYGTAFGNAIDKNYPGVDYDDLMAGVDSVIGRGYVDESRLYVTGCSGGGVLTSWVIAHTDRFAAAAVRCPVTDWISFAGTSDIPLFGFNWFEKPYWEDPLPWLEHSTLYHVGKVKTPTLLMTGELDLRTPMAQTEEYFTALQMRGVPSAMVRFAGEYHGTGSKPSNWMRTQVYLVEWFRRWGGGAAAGGR